MTNFKGSKNFEHGKKISVGVLLCNLGTPDKPTRKAVKRYLAEFLSDPRIVELPRILWLPILHGIILNTRPTRSARAYSKIWTKSGSPLLFHSKSLKTKIERDLDRSWLTFELGMRYGKPSIGSALEALIDKGARQILVVPMYPQYAAATTGSIYDAVFNYCSSLRWYLKLDLLLIIITKRATSVPWRKKLLTIGLKKGDLTNSCFPFTAFQNLHF